MKIISKFNDYYDSVLQYGADESLRFIRHTTEFNSDEYRSQKLNFTFDRRPYFYGKTNKINYDGVAFSILFCGKTYNGLIVVTRDLEKVLSPDEIEYFYDYKSLRDYLALKDKKIIEHLEGKFKFKRWFGNNRSQSIQDWFEVKSVESNRTAMIDRKFSIFLFLHNSLYRSNIVLNTLGLNHNTEAVVNPQLSKLKFFKVVDSFTAYQELSMWVGGVLPSPAMPMIEIEDKYKISEHGFDKWSFRKMPEKGVKR